MTAFSDKQRSDAIDAYYADPNHCKQCEDVIHWEFDHGLLGCGEVANASGFGSDIVGSIPTAPAQG